MSTVLPDQVPTNHCEVTCMRELGFRFDTRDVLIISGILIFFGVLIIGYFQSLGENPIIPGEPAPDFSLRDLNGDTLQLSSLQGKVAVLNFMATWCGACHQQISELEDVWTSFSDQITIVSIDIDTQESEQALRDYVQGYPNASWIWAKDTIHLSHTYWSTAIPLSVVIDSDGIIQYSHIGVTSATTLDNEITHLLN
jgi:peroxiredoxin